MAHIECKLAHLSGLKGPEQRLAMGGVRLFQDQASHLAKRLRRLKNEKNSLEGNIAVLGRVAKLIYGMTLVNDWDGRMGLEDEDEMAWLRENAATFGAVSQLMFDMTQLIEEASA